MAALLPNLAGHRMAREKHHPHLNNREGASCSGDRDRPGNNTVRNEEVGTRLQHCIQLSLKENIEKWDFKWCF